MGIFARQIFIYILTNSFVRMGLYPCRFCLHNETSLLMQLLLATAANIQ